MINRAPDRAVIPCGQNLSLQFFNLLLVCVVMIQQKPLNEIHLRIVSLGKTLNILSAANSVSKPTTHLQVTAGRPALLLVQFALDFSGLLLQLLLVLFVQQTDIFGLFQLSRLRLELLPELFRLLLPFLTAKQKQISCAKWAVYDQIVFQKPYFTTLINCTTSAVDVPLVGE